MVTSFNLTVFMVDFFFWPLKHQYLFFLNSKKFYVYVKNEAGKVIKVSFGDTTGLSIKRDDPARRKSFRARHNCDNPGPKTKARYWSCYQWRAGAKVNN